MEKMIAKAIDTNNAQLAGHIANILRSKGCNYAQVLRIIQTVRPQVNEQTWEALMYEADMVEGEGA